MGFTLKAIGVGLTVAGVKKIMHSIEEENRRENTACRFESDISKEKFYVMVKRGGKGIGNHNIIASSAPVDKASTPKRQKLRRKMQENTRNWRVESHASNSGFLLCYFTLTAVS